MEKETIIATIEESQTDVKEAELKKELSEVERIVQAMSIKVQEDFQKAGEFGRLIKQRSSMVKEFWQPMKDAAHKAHAEICAKEKAMLAPLADAEKVLKQKMAAYLNEQERLRREAEEAARKAAQEEAERMMAKAVEYEANGDRENAEMAMEEAEIMDGMKDSIAVTEGKVKADGVSYTTDWEIVSIDDKNVPIECGHVCIRPVNVELVMRIIRATKGQCHIPGIEFRATKKIAIRK